MMSYKPCVVDALKGGRDSDKSIKVVRMSDSQFLHNSQSIHYDTLSSCDTLVIPTDSKKPQKVLRNSGPLDTHYIHTAERDMH